MRTQQFMRIRYFLLGSFPCWLESLHPLVPPGEPGTDLTATALGPDWQFPECKGHFGGEEAAAQINALEQSPGAKPLHYSSCDSVLSCSYPHCTWPDFMTNKDFFGGETHSSVFLACFSPCFCVANVGRQNCSLHSTYHWVSQHFVLPVSFFGWVDGKCKLHWTALRSKIQFHIFRGVPLQSILPQISFWWRDSFSFCNVTLICWSFKIQN